MKIGAKYSHLNGWEWIMVHKPALWAELEAVINEIDAEACRTKVSKEIKMAGRLLYAPKDINDRFKSLLEAKQWEESRNNYWVTDDYLLIQETMYLPAQEQKLVIESREKRPIYSYNQTDFVKDRIAIEVQFGKYAFIAYDLFVKHLSFYMGGKIDVGIEILPMKSMQEQMSSGPGYYEGALYDIARQGRGVPSVPLVLIGIEP